MNRRGFLGAILAAGVAPFVVKAGSLMAVRVPASGIITAPAFVDVTRTLAEYGKIYPMEIGSFESIRFITSPLFRQ